MNINPLLHDPLRNKGTAFTEVERDALGLRGLLPPHIHTQDEQMARFLAHLRGLPDALEQFVACPPCTTATKRCSSAWCATTSTRSCR
jgi:hypothetical protein